jgi:hypothetical protein
MTSLVAFLVAAFIIVQFSDSIISVMGRIGK